MKNKALTIDEVKTYWQRFLLSEDHPEHITAGELIEAVEDPNNQLKLYEVK